MWASVCWTLNRLCLILRFSSTKLSGAESCWDFPFLLQHKNILRRQLPEHLKLAIAEKIENKLFSKVPRATKSYFCAFQVRRLYMEQSFL